MIDSYVAPEQKKINLKTKGSMVTKIKAHCPSNPVDDYNENKKDCTKLICSLCKKVGEYVTKNLLLSKKKLNQLICTKCE